MSRRRSLESLPPAVPIGLGLVAALAVGIFLVEPALREAQAADEEAGRLEAVVGAGRVAAANLERLRHQQASLAAALDAAERLARGEPEHIEGCGEFREFWNALARCERAAVVRRVDIVRDPAGDEVRFELDVDRLATATEGEE